ncbi:tRNA (guanosine(46)-N7)-methyltransferase TrmB [Spirulina sp. CS-785/01]|uniref:tRNA (guanosine(46)-N7)-methyltransferase TrmB n=1 Tax=Spirulina sp. CS-785/01 TaxID=3021716 RepID=UPI00232C538C|nr:tRNA (guanosine(46)-N7)-methyltransferase TrmB [Spirulina sp. CS-785/01]MDB9315164.1 tRNA (guanosine(46)-N7)-methyltransferase TrmB [Spirulina sp. CS-785/01]
MARVRVRQHVNPLSQKYQDPIPLPNWEGVFANPQNPLFVDIGCARGRFVLGMAQEWPEMNFLGVEIREPLVIEANEKRDRKGLSNLHYVFSNINVDLPCLLASLPPRVLHTIAVQFPDPWFKKRHAKRRIVQPELVDAVAKYLPSGGQVFLQSDIEFVAVEMRDRFLAHPQFTPQHPTLWLTENPFPVITERERATQNKGEPVYRCLLVFGKNEDHR